MRIMNRDSSRDNEYHHDGSEAIKLRHVVYISILSSGLISREILDHTWSRYYIE